MTTLHDETRQLARTVEHEEAAVGVRKKSVRRFDQRGCITQRAGKFRGERGIIISNSIEIEDRHHFVTV